MSRPSTKLSSRLVKPKTALPVSVFIIIFYITLLAGLLIILPARDVVAQTTTSTTPTQTVSTSPPASTPEVASQSDLLLLQAQLQNQAQQLQQAQQDAFDAKNSAGAAVTLSLVAILFGIVGLVVGAMAILRSRAKTTGNSDTTEIEAG